MPNTYSYLWLLQYRTASETPENACLDYSHCKGVGEVVAVSRRKKKHDELQDAQC
jgi:hypothetical protein